MKPKPGPLPDRCFATNPEDGSTVLIMRGERTYYTTKLIQPAELLNAALRVTPAQVQAMVAGSMFGWSCPGADPNNYDERGEFRLLGRSARHNPGEG
jgi:hypothetical protein